MANVELGTNDFFGVVFPLVLADRFFRIYADGARFNLDVFRWDETAQRATFEVVRGQPLQANIASNPTGIVTFAHETTGAFLFKFRPKPGISQIFGQVPVQDEISVRITDHLLAVMRGGQSIATLTRNSFSGFPIGIRVGADGSVGIGVNWLPPGMTLVRRAGVA
jgi:hypothetical protein